MSQLSKSEFRNKIAGSLLGTALGDALGFIAERLDQKAIERRFGKVTRFHVLGNHGFVTDDTEQTALIAYSLARNPSNLKGCLSDFRRSLLLWYLCFPFGIGRATIQACLRIAIGCKNTGVLSAGNGAAMRAAILGAFFLDEPEKRREFGTALAKVTHCDPKAIEGALFVAELAAILSALPSGKTLASCFSQAVAVVHESSLLSALETAADLAAAGSDTHSAAEILNGQPCAFIVNSLPFATFCFLRGGDGNVLECLSETIGGGGDTDTNAAIVGAWLGALKGESVLPADLVAGIDDGPFGPTHLRQLAAALVEAKYGGHAQVPGYSLAHSALRNVFLVPVILWHALFRLLPARGSRGNIGH